MGANACADCPFRNPITGIAGCCARAASGQAAAALPSSVMNSRRFTRSPRRRGRVARRHVEAERLGCLEIDHQLVLGRRLHRQVGGLLAPEDAIDVGGGAPVLVTQFRPIGDQAAFGDEETLEVDCGQFVPGRQRDDQITAAVVMSTPTRRTRSGCCARAASGQAAAPPSSVMNSRRLMLDMGFDPSRALSGVRHDSSNRAALARGLPHLSLPVEGHGVH